MSTSGISLVINKNVDVNEIEFLNELASKVDNVKVIDSPTDSAYLEMSTGILCFFDPKSEERPLFIDFQAEIEKYQKQKSSPSEPLVKALGKKRPLKIADLTGGMGNDTSHFLSLGHEVTTVERHPLSYMLLADAYRRHQSSLHKLVFSQALDFAKTNQDYDIYYFDPMYPEVKKRKSLPRKSMRIFKEFIGADIDEQDVLDELLALKLPRVVVKRPLKYTPRVRPSVSYPGKSVRYDVYIQAPSNS